MFSLLSKASMLNCLLIMTILLGYSCKKGMEDIERTRLVTKPYQSTISECSCNNKESFRIELTLDGKKLCFDRMRQSNTILQDRWLRRWINTIYIERFNADSTLGINIDYYNPAFLKHDLPYLMYLDARDSCEVLGVQVLNFNPYRYCQFCPEDDSRFCSTKTVAVRILSFSDNIIEGTFEGDFTNNGGRLVKVTDGYFKTRLKVEE